LIWYTCQNLMVVKISPHFVSWFFFSLNGLHTHHTSMGWMEHFSLLGVKQYEFLVLSSLMYILHIWSMFRIFIVKYTSHWYVYHMCSFDIWGGETYVFFSSFLLINGSYIEKEYLLLWLHDLTFYFIHFLVSWSWGLFMYSHSTYALMYFVSVSENMETFCHSMTKKGSKYGRWWDVSAYWFLSPNCQRGSLLVFLLAQFGSKM
jgi:hypothetical protein